MGARANGLGYASSTLTDVWGIFNNVAGIAKLEKATAACAYDLHGSITGANRTAAVFATPLKFGVLGAGAYRFGDHLYNEHVVSASFSNKFGLAALGGQVNYIQYHTEGFGSKGVVSFNLGGIAELTPQLSVGAYITNITQPSITETEKLPTKLAAGISYTPIDQILLTAEIEKDVDYDATGKMGIEYKFHSKFTARTAYNVNPNTAYFGLGFKTKRLNIDYAMQYHAVLSFSQQASVSCQLNAK
jgi:hypothetical protein